jgi:hypothetical protein
MSRSEASRIISASAKGRIESFLLLLISSLLLLGGVRTSFSQTKSSSAFGAKLDLTAKLFKKSVENVSSDQIVAKRKSPSLAAFASLAVPGLGELYAGRYDVGKFSTIAEVSLWVFYTVMEVHSDQVRSDAINYAKINAGAQVAGKPDAFFVNIGNYLNSRDYNEQQIQNGNYTSIYNPSTMPSYQWQWQSDADRAKFKDMRIEADQFLNYGRYTAAVVVLNHLMSAINAARLASSVNASAATSLDNSPQTSGIYLRLAASF